ncbi:MAG: glycoside-pentoside-hexuronide (GPH):cation symporter [Erythrobacter sp.]|uniref:MFS transporter n=1 Tax=Erythrobacter sp. TaxID=1042 RepID=UPI002613FAC7|nr:glycoside-pentoside-hexuronide (GPH):cation symporter [Erythrobacter sp.]MDJ0978863.1 glycoside-pentoside-hexuronide (GPH):cation symporter [Erythrobacter sp.]
MASQPTIPSAPSPADTPAEKGADERIGLIEKLGYGLGDIPSGLYLNFFSAYLLFFFVDLGGVAPAAMALMLLLSRVFDAFTDPVMGMISDRTRTRWGRYRPYIAFGAIPYGVTGYLIFAAADLSPGWLLVWAYVSYGLCMLAFTATNVPYSGLLGVISPSTEQRANVTAYRMFFSGFAGIMVGVLATTLVRELGGGDEALGIKLTMGLFAAISSLCFLITFATTKERIPAAPTTGSVKGDLGRLVRTGAWIATAIAAIFGVLSIASRATSARFWFKYVAGDDGAPVFLFLDRFGLFLTALALGQVSGVVLGYALQRRFEKSHLIITGGLMKISGIAIFYLLPLDAVWPQTLAQLMVGTGFGFLMVLSFSMFTDIAEFIDWRSGVQMTALTMSASIFAVKVGAGLGAATPGLVLELTGFEREVAQSAEALAGIEFAFAWLPGLVLIPAGIAMMFYPLSHKLMRQVETDLTARRSTV